MNRPVLLSIFVLAAAIAGSAKPTQALCINDGTLSLNRDAPPDETSFVNSSPAGTDSNFKLELNLNDGLDIFEADTEDRESASETDVAPAETAAASTTDEMPEDASTSATVENLEADSSSAADLETADLEAQTQVSREDYLNSRASEINNCFN